MIGNGVGKRTAHTLIEMVVVMSAAVVVLTLSATYLHRMMSISSQSAKFLDAEHAGLRFSRQFRQDALLASSANVVSEPGPEAATVLQLECPYVEGEAIDYRFFAGKAVRTARVESGSLAQEEYEFPEGTRWNVEHDTSQNRVALTARNSPDESITVEVAPPPVWRVPFEMHLESTLGRLTTLNDELEAEVTE